MRISIFVLGSLLAGCSLLAQDIDPGRRLFENRCATCHGADGNGGPMGPPITSRLATREAQQLAALIREGLPARGMPPSQVADPEMAYLLKFLRTIQQRALGGPVVHMTVQTIDGKTLGGQVLGEGFEDLQLRTDDKRIHLLRRAGDLFREVTSETNWPTYNGDPGGNRYTTLTQINKNNVTRLAPKWVFTIPGAGRLEVTPVVVDGIMYVTAPNQCFALDAGTGRDLWHYQLPPTPGRRCGGSGACRKGASLARRPGKARTSITAARQRGSPAAMTPSSMSYIGRPAILARSTTETIASETISTPIAFWRWTARPASSSGITNSLLTISGTGTPRKRRFW